MPRIAGVDIPDNKRIDIALTYIYGVGRSNVESVLSEANVKADTRANKLTNDELSRISRVLDRINTEGNLRKLVRDNIQRLQRIGSYRGSRHAAGLPSRGQRTRTNARTRRGRRQTIGAVSKDQAQKAAQPKK